MLRRRPRRTTALHPATGWLCLGVLYLTATVANMLLAFRMTEAWPALVAILMAGVTVLCAVAAWRRF
jgi:hypothetical protein